MFINFWADAIVVYAAYIHNCTYHDGISNVPYNRCGIGKRANMCHLRAFGSKAIVKRSGPRPTKGDPHDYYDGRFLRFGATDWNIVCFDETTKREKIARHCTMDEFHYDSEVRPPGGSTCC